MYEHGWYQVAVEQELSEGLTPLRFGNRRLMAVKRDGTVRVFDGVCPHRGASLAHGGKLDGERVQCPFHGYQIALGSKADEPFCVREYACTVFAGMVLVRLSSREQPDLPRALRDLEADHMFIPAVQMQAETRIEVVTENGFDSTHFKAVHDLLKDPCLEPRPGALGEMVAEGTFEIPRWDHRRRAFSPVPYRTRYEGRVFSPGAFIAQLRGEPPFNYTIITFATPRGDGNSCDIRVTLAMPRAGDAPAAGEEFVRFLTDSTRDGLERDRKIWNQISLELTPHWTAQDTAAVAFQKFCRSFYAA
jgi:phenylpropionate dioxygenase-like ring-hydroxylating dioxygenase large terminal subunit